MTPVPERVLNACGGDHEYAQHVWDDLERVRLLRENGGTPTTVLPEQHCPTCLVEYDEQACPCCGRVQKAEAHGTPSKSAPRASDRG